MAGYNNTLITDELLRLVTPVIPIPEWRRIAYEAFNLTVNEVDAIESAQTRADVIFHLLHQAVQRDQMPAKVLKQKIEDARVKGINIRQKGLDNIEEGNALPSEVLLGSLSRQLVDYESFLVGYMGYTMEEVVTSMHLSQDYKSCVLKMLSLWRCKDGQDGVKTVGQLLSALKDVLQAGPYHSLVTVTEDWWSTKATRSTVVTRNYMQTNMPVSNIEVIQSQLKNIYTNTLSTLCPLPWLEKSEDVQYNFDDVFIPLRTIDIKIQQKISDIQNTTESLRKIRAQLASMKTLLLNGVEKMTTTSPRNILIQSVAGGGKSTLCNRLAYLWANNSAEIQRLDNFDLVFLIKVNLIQRADKSIYDYIHRELLPDVDNICDVIKDLRMLFIVDGYDELSGKEIVVEDLLAKHVCPQSTVILTTRDGQTPALKYFSNGFGITSLSSDDVQTFLSKLPRSTDTTLTQIDLDTHPLGAILSTPLFLWFYYLLGEEVFKGVDVSNRTSLFTHIVDGILHKASRRLNKTEAECNKAVRRLERAAYKCLCMDKLYFDRSLGDLSANLGLVKQSQSHLNLKSHTAYTFTHKSLAEYLTARYIVKHTDGDVNVMLCKIPEVQDPDRRKASLILYFVCGLLTREDQLMSLCETFLPEVASSLDSHDNHLTLQCCAEMTQTELVAHVMRKRVCEEVKCGEKCNQYCALGIKRMHGSHPTHIRRVTLDHCTGDFTCRFLCLDAARDVKIVGRTWQSRDTERLCDVTRNSLQRLELWYVDITSDSVRHISHYISRGTQLKELELRSVWNRDDDVGRRSAIPSLLQHLSSHPLPSLHYLRVLCEYDSEVRALTTFLPQCTNLRTLEYQRALYSVVSESVEEEMWEVVVRRCRSLEEVRVWGDDSDVACDRLVSVMRKLSEREGIQALNLRKIERVDRTTGDVDYAQQVKHLLPALQQ